MRDPRITVLMSVYNGEKYLRKAVDSILSQTFKDFEFLIINDGSTDRTVEILHSYDNPRIRIINNEENVGLTKSLNKGLKLAKGKYIARMDADDISMPERFERQVEFLEKNPDIGVLGVNCPVINDHGRVTFILERPTSHTDIVKELLSENQFVHSSLMLRMDVLSSAGGYNEDFRLAQDYELILRLSKTTQVANLPEPLHMWRNNISGDVLTDKRKKQILLRNKARERYLNANYSFSNSDFKLVLANFLNNPTDKVLFKYFFRMLKYRAKDFFELLVNERKPRQQDYPSSIIFLMKNKCNANCIMCGLSYRDNKEVTEITLESYKMMLANLEMDEVKEITFSGGGEPLLCKDFIEIVRHTRERFQKVKLHIYTNGIALSDQFAQELIQQKSSLVSISLNASTAEIHKEVMRVNAFDNVVRNIKDLVSLRNKMKAKTKIHLSFIASLLNIKELPELISLASELGVDEVSMSYCRFYSRKFKLDCINYDEHKIDEKNSLFFHKELSDNILRNSIRLASEKRVKFRHESLFEERDIHKRRCTWPTTTILIGPEGEIYPCGGGEVMFYNAVRDNELCFGNVLKEHASVFWNNKDFSVLRESCCGKDKKISQCNSCNHTMNWEGPNSKRSHFINV